MQALRPDLVSARNSRSTCRTGAERVFGAAPPRQETVAVLQSPFISELISSLVREFRGEKEGQVPAPSTPAVEPNPIAPDHFGFKH